MQAVEPMATGKSLPFGPEGWDHDNRSRLSLVAALLVAISDSFSAAPKGV